MILKIIWRLFTHPWELPRWYRAKKLKRQIYVTKQGEVQWVAPYKKGVAIILEPHELQIISNRLETMARKRGLVTHFEA